MQLPPVVMVPNPVSVTLGIPPFLYFLQYAVASGGNGTKSCVSDFGNSSAAAPTVAGAIALALQKK